MIHCVSLHLLPSLARCRFYDDIKIVINLTTGYSQFRYTLYYHLISQLGSSLWIYGNFSSARFFPSLIVVPSIKMFLFLFPVTCPSSILTLLFPLVLQFLISSFPSIFPSLPPYPLNFLRKYRFLPLLSVGALLFLLGLSLFLRFLKW